MKQSLLLVAVGFAVIFLFVLVFIMPSKKAIATLDADIAAAKFKVETQEKLGPLYKGLTESVKKIDTKTSLPASQALPKNKLNSVSGVISGMAQKTNLTVLSVFPETSADGGSTFCYISLRGNFLDFRNFLKEIGSLPYVDSVHEIKINTGKGSREFNLKLKLMVA